jgi:hypothetical protein
MPHIPQNTCCAVAVLNQYTVGSMLPTVHGIVAWERLGAKKTFLGADGAVAVERIRRVGRDFKFHCAAMTATLICL